LCCAELEVQGINGFYNSQQTNEGRAAACATACAACSRFFEQGVEATSLVDGTNDLVYATAGGCE
jgi:hypothetical protein